jgi:hypothetical protein
MESTPDQTWSLLGKFPHGIVDYRPTDGVQGPAEHQRCGQGKCSKESEGAAGTRIGKAG